MAETEMIFVPGTGIIRDRKVPHCGDCRWFDDVGYETSDPEYPELRMGYCQIWRSDTQACGFCHCGIPKENET